VFSPAARDRRDLLNTENFPEGDYFEWYLEELDADLGGAIAGLVRAR